MKNPARTSLIVSWLISLVSLISGIILAVVGRSTSLSVQIAANTGALKDPSVYYGKIQTGSLLVSLGTGLITCGILAIVLTVLFSAVIRSFGSQSVAIPGGFLAETEDAHSELDTTEPSQRDDVRGEAAPAADDSASGEPADIAKSNQEELSDRGSDGNAAADSDESQ
ncbi:hypothetical protein I6E29_03510 [Arcanobacterium haemolyticum]|nr:hypothetical protein [Arcanobacterium haemolyticum]